MRKVLDWITWKRIPADQIGFKNLEQESRTLILYSLFYILLAFGVGNLIIHFPQPILGAKEFVQDFWYAAVFKFSFLLILPSLIFFKRWKYGIQDLLFGLKPKIGMNIKGALLITIGFLLNIRHIPRVSEAMPSFEDAEFRLILGIVFPLLIAGLPEELFLEECCKLGLRNFGIPLSPFLFPDCFSRLGIYPAVFYWQTVWKVRQGIGFPFFSEQGFLCFWSVAFLAGIGQGTAIYPC